MKKLSIVFLLAIVASSCQDFTEELFGTVEDHSIVTRAAEAEMQEYYWYQGKKIYLTRNNKFVNVVVDGKLKKSSDAGRFAMEPLRHGATLSSTLCRVLTPLLPQSNSKIHIQSDRKPYKPYTCLYGFS